MEYSNEQLCIIHLNNIFVLYFIRYEWSVGFTGITHPKGIFDLIKDKVWQDAGQFTDAIFTLVPGQVQQYIYFMMYKHFSYNILHLLILLDWVAQISIKFKWQLKLN
jgi:hypothetical protein